MIYSLFESLLEAIDKTLSEGRISWGAIITALLFFNKIQRNKEFRLRDQRVERNQQRIMEKLGVEGEWASDSHQNGLKYIYPKLIFCLSKVMKHPKRRMNMLTNLFKTSVSKKLTALLLGAAVAVLNKKLNLDLTPDELLTFLIVVGGYILGQSHVDARKITAGIKDSPLLQMGFTEAIPILSEIHSGINKILEDVKKNDNSAAFHDAMQAYAQIKPILDALKHPEPLAVIEDKVAV